MERYFQKLPKGATPLPIRWKPPSPKRPKKGPGRPRKVTITLDHNHSPTSVSSSEEQEEREDCLTTDNSVRMKRLYHPKQKRLAVAYAKEHSVAAATKKFSLPRTTLNRWMVAGYFN